MDFLTVSFFGHRTLENPSELEEKLIKCIHRVLRDYEYVDFLVGRNGEFDLLVTSVIRRLKKEYRSDNSSLTLVLPYMTAELKRNERAFSSFYDNIEICEKASCAHPKSAIKVRNFSMVDRSDLVAFYVERKNGGAYQTYSYAQKQGKNIIVI